MGDLEVEIYEDAGGAIRVRIRSGNGNIVLREAHGPGYSSSSSARRMLRRAFEKIANGRYRLTETKERR